MAGRCNFINAASGYAAELGLVGDSDPLLRQREEQFFQLGLGQPGNAVSPRTADTLTKPGCDDLEPGPIKCARDSGKLRNHVLALSALFDHGDHSGELALRTPQSVQYC